MNLASDLCEVEYLSNHVMAMLSFSFFFFCSLSLLPSDVAAVLTTLSTSAAEIFCFHH